MFKFFYVLLFLLVSAEASNIVSVEWLQSNLKDENLVVIDLRTSEEYNKGHLEGAVSIPAMKNLYDKKFFLPKLNFLKERLSEAGIDSNSIVVAYGSGIFIRSARLFWILKVLGHDKVAILDVGYEGLSPMKITTAPTTVQRKEFMPRIDNKKIETKLSTMFAIGKKVIVDGREREHYNGEKSSAKRFGHIPTAINYACTDNYTRSKNGNKIKDLVRLKSMYKTLDIDKEILLYCNGGSEAALDYVILKELGYKASVYDGSWYEWGNDPVVPIENLSKKI